MIDNRKILKDIITAAILLLLSSCIAKNDIVVTLKKTIQPGMTITKIQVINNQIIITGSSLNTINTFDIKDGTITTNLQIESKSSTSLVANTLANMTFSTGKSYDFLLTSASLSTTVTVNFSLCDSLLGGKGFSCSTSPNDKEVLAYDNVSGSWKTKVVNGLIYQGVWNATTAFPAATTPGEYYLVSVANAPYAIGDWIVFNGTTFQRINNSTPITSVFGRTGAITGNKGDYVLTKLGDVDLTTTPPIANQILKYDGVNWVPGTILATESDPSALAFAKAALPVCGAGQVLKSDGTNFSCVLDITGGAFSGTASRAIITNATGAIVVSSVTSTEVGYLTGVTSAIQTQLDAKEILTNLAGDVRITVLTGLSTLTNMAITATDSVLGAFGKLQAQITAATTTTSGKADLTNATQTITAAVVTGLSSPSIGGDAVNKNYVDSFGQWHKNANGIDYASGNVGVGTTTPGSKLEIQGSALSRLNVIAAGATVDLSLSNTHVLRAPAGSVITLSNALQGGAYTLVISDVTSRLYTFTGGCDNTYFNPANVATTQRTTYTIMVGDDPDGNGIPDCFISWTTGFN